MSLTHTLPEKFLFVIGGAFLSILNFFLIKGYLSLFYALSFQNYYLAYYILIIIFFKNIDRVFGGNIEELAILTDRIITKELKESYSINYVRYLPNAFSYAHLKCNESFTDKLIHLLRKINSSRLDKEYGIQYMFLLAPGKYPYPIVNYYYHEYFLHLSVYYIFIHSFYTFTQLITLPLKLCFVTFYFVNLLWQLVPKYGHIEVLKPGPLLEYYPFLNYVKPPYLELDKFGDVKTLDQHSQYTNSVSERLHFFLFYNLFVYTYYYAFEHVQSILYIFVEYHYTRDWVVSRSDESRSLGMWFWFSTDPEDRAVPRGMALIKIKNSASVFSKIIMFAMYLLANHSFKTVNFFTRVHDYAKLSNRIAVEKNLFIGYYLFTSHYSLDDFFTKNLLWEDNKLQAKKFIAKDERSNILMYEDISPYTMSPRYQNFLPRAFSSIHNVVTLVRYINFNKTTHVDYIWKEIPLHPSYYDWLWEQ